MKYKRVAIVAEWLTWRGGGESVLDALLEVFNEADLYTTVYNEQKLPEYKKYNVKTTFLQKIPVVNRKHQAIPPILLKAIRSIDLKGYDLIISLSSAIGKGIRKPEGSIHVTYCHTPMRYVWQTDIDDRLIRLPLGRLFLNYLKNWDLKTNEGVDYFLTNSSYTAERIKRLYNRKATVIYPPITLGDKVEEQKDDYFLCISRLVGYKRFDLAIKACSQLGRKLKVAGDGPELKNLKKLASKDIEFLGRVDSKEKWKLISKAKAVIFPAEEDFGIVPVEAMSVGTPVIAFGRGGATESISEGKTGVFFNTQDVQSLVDAITKFEKLSFNAYDIRKQSEKFSKEIFEEKIKEFIDKI